MIATATIQYKLNKSDWWTDLPEPSAISPESYQVVTESNRTVGRGALLHKQLLANKQKFYVTWYYLTPSQYAMLENLFLGHNFFYVNMCDTRNGISKKTIEVYGGDLKAGDVHRATENGLFTGYRNVTWSFIER